jgi:hypothetical protein
MRKAEKLEMMVDWFHRNFEDPAESTPYESAEGGYIWIWGGPYEARDELYGKLGDLVSERVIEEAAQHIERHGIYDWAPVHKGDDYDDIEPDEPTSLDIFSDEPSENYGTARDHEARRQIRAALNELQNGLHSPRPIGIGHNRPPDEDEEPEEIKELRPAIAELSAELAKPNPRREAMTAVAERGHADILADKPLAPDPVSVTMPAVLLTPRSTRRALPARCGIGALHAHHGRVGIGSSAIRISLTRFRDVSAPHGRFP